MTSNSPPRVDTETRHFDSIKVFKSKSRQVISRTALADNHKRIPEATETTEKLSNLKLKSSSIDSAIAKIAKAANSQQKSPESAMKR